MDLLNETVLLKANSTLLNLFIRETSQFLCYERLLNMTYVAYKRHFSAKCNSGRIAIQWFHIKHYLDYQYTKFQPYTFRVQKMCVFARYATLVPRLHVIFGFCYKIMGFCDLSKLPIALKSSRSNPQHLETNCVPFSCIIFNIYSCTQSGNENKLTPMCFLLNSQ